MVDKKGSTQQAEYLTRLADNLLVAGQQRPGALVTNVMNGGRHTVVGGPTMAVARPTSTMQAALNSRVRSAQFTALLASCVRDRSEN